MKMVCLFLIVLFCSCNKSSKENSPEEVKVIDSLPTNGVIDSSKLKKVIYYNHQTNAGSYYDEDGYNTNRICRHNTYTPSPSLFKK